MPYSALIYRDLLPTPGPARATIVTLHGVHGALDDLVPLAQSLGPDLHIVAPEAARSLYRIRDAVAHAWYGGWSAARPEPASFGDSLAQLERFLHDVRERAGTEPPPPWLLGFDQGAVLALSLGLIAPDLLAGVMAVSGCLPTFSDPSLLEPAASTLPVLLVSNPADPALPAAEIEATATHLAEFGAAVATEWIAGARGFGPDVEATLRTWFADQMGR